MNSIIAAAIARGIPEKTIVLLLLLPIIATIVAIIRQIIGFKTFGIYVPSILTIVFLDVGLGPGLIVFLAILFTGTFFRYLLKKVRLLYLSRMALVLTLVGISVILLFLLAAYLGINSITRMSIISVLIMIILVERFVNAQIERGFEDAATLTLETLAISVVGYFILVWQSLQNFILHYPWIVLIIILLNLILGRWSGLRLMEYIRFREVLRHGKKQ